MRGKIFITSTGYDPELGKQVKDPHLDDDCPTLGACRPDIREQLDKGDHIFVVSGKVQGDNQFVMGGFEIAEKIDASEAYDRFPHLRLQQLPNGDVTGNVIVDAFGNQHELDDHSNFERRIRNYIVGKNLLSLRTETEIAEGREQTLAALRAILQRTGDTPYTVLGRCSGLTEAQVLELRDWLNTIKRECA